MKEDCIALFERNDRGNNDDTAPDWIARLLPGVSYFPHVKLGDGFAKHALSTDTGVLLIWPLAKGADFEFAARNLIAAKEELNRSEPLAHPEMVLLSDNGSVALPNDLKEAGIHCFDVPQFLSYAINFFSTASEQCRFGKIAFRIGNFKEAFAKLNVDNPTDPEVLSMLGYMYEHGKGVAQDRKYAETCYWKAAVLGDSSAQDALGDILDEKQQRLKDEEDRIIDEVRKFSKKYLEEDDDEGDEEDDDDMTGRGDGRNHSNGTVRRSSRTADGAHVSVEINGHKMSIKGGDISITGVGSVTQGSSRISRNRQTVSGKIYGSCSQNLIVESGCKLEITGSCFGNVKVCEKATLICHGSCSGNVEIASNGRFVCHGSMSGNIRNYGGKVKIHGSFSGRRTDF